MNAIVNGQNVEWSSLTYPPLGFGQMFAEDVQPARYYLKVTYDELSMLFQRVFDAFVVEIQRDDEATGESCADTMPALAKYGYPKYDKLVIEDKAALADLIHDVLALEFLQASFPQKELLTIKFVINSIEKITPYDTYIEIVGKCYQVL